MDCTQNDSTKAQSPLSNMTDACQQFSKYGRGRVGNFNLGMGLFVFSVKLWSKVNGCEISKQL